MLKILVFVLFSLCSTGTTEERFNDFILKFKKEYSSTEERDLRRSIFVENLKTIDELNKGDKDTVFGITKFSDLSPEEFKERLKLKSTENNRVTKTKNPKNNDTYIDCDWRDWGGVTAVKDQGNCGSCWAFSAVGSQECACFKKTGKLVDLSPQQLVDCEKKDDGCDGGEMDNAHPYAIENGMESEKDYPYEAVTGKCRFKNSSVACKFSSWKNFDKQDEFGMDKVLCDKDNGGTISIGMDATLLQFYDHGVIHDKEDCEWDELNHGVLLVAHASKAKFVNGFWKIKNSWGDDWGLDGYFEIISGTDCMGLSQDSSIIFG